MKENELLKDLEIDVDNTISLYETYLSGSALRTRQMIERNGVLKALEKLVKSPDSQQGFKKLRDNNQLDNSFEALVLKYKDLFPNDAVIWAEFRLKNPDALNYK